MQIGKLRHYITLRTAADDIDSEGGVNEPTWTNNEENVPARIVPVSGSEEIFGDQPDGRITHRIWLRYKSGIDTKWSILFGSRVFYVTGVRNIDERSIFMVIDVIEDT